MQNVWTLKLQTQIFSLQCINTDSLGEEKVCDWQTGSTGQVGNMKEKKVSKKDLGRQEKAAFLQIFQIRKKK